MRSRRSSTGGAISSMEVPNLQNNLRAVIEVIRFFCGNIMYAELNAKGDYCQVRGYDGEIEIREGDGKLVWTGPSSAPAVSSNSKALQAATPLEQRGVLP